MTGFMERFSSKRIQIIGQTEMAYISHLTSDRLSEISDKLFSQDLPLVVVSKGMIAPDEFIEAADKYGTSVLSSKLSTAELTNRLSAFMDHVFAPSIKIA